MLIIALSLNAGANILLKIGSGKIGNLKGLPLTELILHLLGNIPLVLGLLFFALNVVFYTGALSRLNLSVAYPIMMTGGVLIITLFSYFYLKESLNSLQLVGIFCITVGIALVTSQ